MKIKLFKILVLIMLSVLLFGCENKADKPDYDICYYPYLPVESIMHSQYIVIGNYLGKSADDGTYSVYNIEITEVLKGNDIDDYIGQTISIKGSKYCSIEKSGYIDYSEILQSGDECMFFFFEDNDFYMSISINLKDINNSLSFIINLSFKALGLPEDTTKEEFINFIKTSIYEYTPREEELINTPICDVSATYLFGDIDNYNLPEDKIVKFFDYTFLTDKYGRATVVKNTSTLEFSERLEAYAYPYKIIMNSDFEKIEVGMGLAEIVSFVEVPYSASESELLLEYKSDEGSFFTIYLNENLTFNRLVKH